MMDIKELNTLAVKLRYDVVKMIGVNHKGHYGGAMSAAELVAALYFSKMKIDSENPKWKYRDRFVLSKGHSVFIQYAALAEKGFFPKEEMLKAKTVGSILQGHPDMKKTPGVECNAGSLGQGISQAAGMAAGLKLDNINSNVYCILGDGELSEGIVWEAVMAASNFKLNNLICFVDRNGFCASDALKNVYDIGDIRAKLDAFGWHTMEIDGHNMQEILDALDEADKIDKPVMIIAHTIKGKGIKCFENNPKCHNGFLNKEDFNKALNDFEVDIRRRELNED